MEKFSMKIVKSLFKEGVEKREIFNRAIEAGLDKQEVSAYLARRPDRHLAEKYNIASKILLWILLALVFFCLTLLLIAACSASPDPTPSVIAIELIFWLPLIGYIVYLMYKEQADIYDNLSAILLIIMLKSAVYLAEYFTGLGVLIVMGVEFVLIFYVIILDRQLFPYQNFFGLLKDDEGIYIYTQDLTK